MLILEDMFGFTHPLLSTPDHLIKSTILKEKRKNMSDSFQNIMFTSVQKRDALSKEPETKKMNKLDNDEDKDPKSLLLSQIFENDPKIDRMGFVFVCDVTDTKTFEDVKAAIIKLHQIEKSNNIAYPKCILINKNDKCYLRKSFFKEIGEINELKQKYKVDVYRTSALTGEGIEESFRKFIAKIHQQQIDSKQMQGVADNDNDFENDKVNELDLIFCRLLGMIK